MKKKIATIVLSFVMCVALAVPALADTSYTNDAENEEAVNKESTDVYVSFNLDDYSGVEDFRASVAESIDMDDSDEYGIKPFANASPEYVWDSCDEAYADFLAELKPGMKIRDDSVSATYHTDDPNVTVNQLAAFVSTVSADVWMHTGDPSEGDYMYWNCSAIKGGAHVDRYSDSSDITVTLDFLWRTTKEEEEAVTEKVDDILDSFDWNKNTSDYEKISDIYGYVCDNVTYDYEHLAIEQAGGSYSLMHTTYAALINGTAVCQGIGTSMYRLLLESGISTRCVYGRGSSEDHLWNIVELGGCYYNIDATWDLGNSEYQWFLKSNDDFANHTRDASYNTDVFNATCPMANTNYVPSEENIEDDQSVNEDLQGEDSYNKNIGDADVKDTEDESTTEKLEDDSSSTGDVQTVPTDADIDTVSFCYDDYVKISDAFSWADSSTQYVIYDTEDVDITSYKVEKGKETATLDENLVEVVDGTTLHAVGVGEGTISFTKKNSSSNSDVYQVHIIIEPAKLTLMCLTGQSNMEGYCDSATGYDFGASVVCDDGTVYSTYTPSTNTNGRNITGISSITACSASDADSFVAGSLTGDKSINGKSLVYPVNALTSSGSGKTGLDAGIAYEWNKKTGDKVWVVNTAYGATSITKWIPGGTCNNISSAVWADVLKTYNAEIGNHYTAGDKLMFWLQGESDKSMDASTYENYFDQMYTSMDNKLDLDAFGIIEVRSSVGSYTNSDELHMTGPRIAQYYLGSGNSNHDNVYVVSNVNEQWVSDSGVNSYFKNAYTSGKLSYPTRNGTTTLPTTMSKIHSDIHYSQLGHNENGITAADGMYAALYETASASNIKWYNENGSTISSVTLELTSDTEIAVPVTEPAYAGKTLTTSTTTNNVFKYSKKTGLVSAVDDVTTGSGKITATSGNKTSNLSVTVKTPIDLRSVAGSYTGLYKYNGDWWYLKNGIIQKNYTSVVKNENGWWYVENGKVRFDYTGFASNSNGKWYIENGKVTFNKQGILKDTTGAIGSKGDWYYVIGSKVQTSFTGLSNFSNENGWWYIVNGKVDFTHNGVDKNCNGWWYVVGGKVQFGFTGLANYKNVNGWWYIVNGKVDFNHNGVDKNCNGWWYVTGGKVDFSHNGVDKNKNGWWYIVGGKVQFDFTGLGNYGNTNGWWYIENGRVNFDHNGVDKNCNGWWYVIGSKVQFNYTGVANYKNENGWWYIRNGKVDFSYTGRARNNNGIWNIVNGKVIF